MPKVAQTVTVSTTQEMVLAPQVRLRLLRELKAYQQIQSQIKALEEAADKHKGVIAGIRNDTGEMSIQLEGFTSTLVAGSRKKFNEKKYVSLGGDLDLYNKAVEKKPSKPYEKITCPGDKEHESDNE